MSNPELRLPKCQEPFCRNDATKVRRVRAKLGSTRLQQLCEDHYNKTGHRVLERRKHGN